jgi:hypothetical protein
VVVGDDWKAVLLWRALYDAGVYVNVAIHPAGPARRRAAADERDGDATTGPSWIARWRRSKTSSRTSSASMDRCRTRVHSTFTGWQRRIKILMLFATAEGG